MFGFISKNPKRNKASGPTFSASDLAWFSYASITNAAEKLAFHNFNTQMQTRSYYSKLLYMNYCSPTSSTAALKDCIGLTTGVAVNAPVYLAHGGFTFDGATTYIRTGLYANILALSTASASLYTYLRENAGGGCMLGTRSASTAELSMFAGVVS